MATLEGVHVMGLRQFGALGTDYRRHLHPSLADSFQMEAIQARMVPRLTQRVSDTNQFGCHFFSILFCSR
jgi:hypothetical protein